MKDNHKLALAQGPLLAYAGQYRHLVGRLIYLTIIRPDLCYAVHNLSHFVQASHKEHMNVAYRVLFYLKGTSDYGILIHASPDSHVFEYCDSD